MCRHNKYVGGGDEGARCVGPQRREGQGARAPGVGGPRCVDPMLGRATVRGPQWWEGHPPHMIIVG